MSARTRSLPRGIGPLHGVEDHGTGIAALGAPHDLDAGPLRPQVELLGRGGPEGVARGQEHRTAGGLLASGHLADGGRLARRR